MITCKFEDGGDAALRHAVVHVLAIHDGKLLLVKRAPGILEAGKWGFPGGFVDRDETISQCALRELMEETGYEGKVNELFRINSNPNRKNDNGRQNIAFEMIVDVGQKVGEPDWEQTEVAWRDLGSLEEDEMAFDHYQSINDLKRYLKEKFQLPILYPQGNAKD